MEGLLGIRSAEQQMDIRNFSFVKRESEVQIVAKPLPTGWTDPCLPPIWTDPGHLTSVTDAQWRVILSFLDSRTARGAKGEFADYFRVVSKTFREKADKMRKRLDMQQELPHEPMETAVAWAVEHKDGETLNATNVTAMPLPLGPALAPMDQLLRAVDDETMHHAAASNSWHNHAVLPNFAATQAFRLRSQIPPCQSTSKKNLEAPQSFPKGSYRASLGDVNGGCPAPEPAACSNGRKHGKCSDDSSSSVECSSESKRQRLQKLVDCSDDSHIHLLTGMMGFLARTEPLRARAAADHAAGKLLRARRKAAAAFMSQLERVTALRDECDVEEHRARYGAIIVRLQSRLDAHLGAVC